MALTQWKRLRGLSELLERFDVFIFDQFGVLHNGIVAYPHAVHAFNQLVQHKPHIRVILLSNTSRRSVAVAPLLRQLGFATDFDGLVTGGEEAFRFLGAQIQLRAAALVTYDFDASFVARQDNQQSLFHGLDNISLAPIEQADFILVEGTHWLCVGGDDRQQIQQLAFGETGEMDESLKSFLKRGLERKLPLYCTNPDLISIKAYGLIAHMGGQIADYYESLGGQVVRFGKPDPKHFDACIQLASSGDSTTPQPSRQRVVHIGDSLVHDVQGANAAQISSVFIARGIHAEELDLDPNPTGPSTCLSDEELQQPDPAKLDALFHKHRQEPTFVLRELKW